MGSEYFFKFTIKFSITVTLLEVDIGCQELRAISDTEFVNKFPAQNNGKETQRWMKSKQRCKEVRK